MQASSEAILRNAVERNDLKDHDSPSDLKVVQLVNEPDRWFRHIYMETPKFTPDGNRLVLQEFLFPDETETASNRRQLRHYYLCDIEDPKGISLRQLTDDAGLERAPAVTPDGTYLYYIVSDSSKPASPITFMRASLDSMQREKLFVIDAPLSGGAYPSMIYDLGTMAPDGLSYATACYLGNDTSSGPWGLLVVNLADMTPRTVELGPEYRNIHPQYCRNPETPRDIMIQHNHPDDPGARPDGRGSGSSPGADVHVIRDDGTNWRGFPWGRDGREYCSGHQAWRGTQRTAIASTGRHDTIEICQELVESHPVPQPEGGDHRGLLQDGHRNMLSRSVRWPRFSHFGFDNSGNRLICDCRPDDNGVDEIVLAHIPDGDNRTMRHRHLLSSHNRWESKGHSHPHPFLSPSGERAFFNSNTGGSNMNVFMLENLDYPEQ